ncbi:oxygen-independent coproporphyrinogen III oxidase [Zunongwangia sp.]|uniref:oxygen-independent coproporphyrinogen III oxidase n=1 Tax=Zunongwangia sp. TaxID=1965325 RepID=UPI003AA7C70E
MQTNLIRKYNVAGPRYTSYPTVPYWEDSSFSLHAWKERLRRSYVESKHNGISLYIHLPYCESMCTFCGCNKRITKNHLVEIPYIKTLLIEWDLYTALFDEVPVVKEVHLGGGTPTFFSPENLRLLLEGLFRDKSQRAEAKLSFEGHPNNTTSKHLKTLADLGFKRVSFGVQDYNEKVQKAIHRVQPFENVANATRLARENGFSSVGHDIIFGLPFQTTKDIEHTIALTKKMMPERIAFYSYAHVPWIKGNGQRGFKDEDLPKPEEKKAQFELGKQLLLEAGYQEIGMDHFALPKDELAKNQHTKKIHRNFMGYTTETTQIMIGLGVSAIGDSWYGFGQNVKNIEEYKNFVERGSFPIYRGHILNDEDLVIRRHILNLMCKLETSWQDEKLLFPELPDVLIKLKEMENDGILKIGDKNITITEKGRAFVRNVCMAFDLRLQRNKPETKLFSMTI